MSVLVTTLVAALRGQLPEYPLADLTAAVESVLAGTAARLNTNQLQIVFGDHATLTNCTISIGNTHLTVVLPEPPDPLKIAFAHYASMPLDVVPDVQSTALPAISHMPFFALPTFVGRTDELRQLAHALSEARTAALVPAIASGIIGVGKTSLAIEFAHRYGPYFQGGVFWVDCAAAANVPANIARCGLTMGLYPTITDLDRAVTQVRRAWQDAIPRLLIFDNCEDPAILSQYTPATGGSRVLITTRRTQWSWPTIQVGVLARGESIAFLRQLAPYLDEANAEQIAEFISDLPFGLRLVGCYLRTYRMDAQTYLSMLPAQHRSLTGRGVRQAQTELPARTEINLQRVIQRALLHVMGDDPIHVLACTILDSMCHLAPGQIIADTLIKECFPEGTDRDDATDAWQLVTDLGFLTISEPGWGIMHRLLHGVLIPFHATVDGYRTVRHVMLMRIAHMNTMGYPFAESWLIPHAEMIIDSSFKEATPLQSDILNALGLLYAAQGRYDAAESLYVRTLAIRESVLGEQNRATAQILNNLAELYEQQGRYTEAEPLLKRSLAVMEAVSNEEDLDIAGRLHNLGGLYEKQGRYEEAEPLLRRALMIRERIVGWNDARTGRSLNNLALLHAKQGRYDEAETAYLRAIESYQAALEDNHPDIALAMNNVAELYRVQRRYHAAEPLYQRALAIWEAVVGEEHPDTAMGLNNLGLLYYEQGRYAESEALYHRAIGIKQTLLGEGHADTAISLSNLALLYYTQQRFDDAELLYNRAFATTKAALGDTHPTTTRIMANLAGLYYRQEKYALAAAWFNQVLTSQEAVLGWHHPTTQNTFNNLLYVYRTQGWDAQTEAILAWASTKA